MTKLQFLPNQVEKIRTITHADGRKYLVAPVVPIREGVLNGLYYPADEIGHFIAAWNGIPVTVGHPQHRGRFVSANSPDIEARNTIGRFWNAEVKDGKLVGELWVDVEKAERMNTRADEVLGRIKSNKPTEVSTGIFVDAETESGRFGGKAYSAIARNLRPDHLAILLDEEGACSWRDGCGVPRSNRKEGGMEVNLISAARTPEYEGTESSDWGGVAKSLSNYIAGYFKFNPDAEQPEGDDEWQTVDDLSAAARSWIASKSLLGNPEAETFDELQFFPVVNPNTNKLNENALRAVISGRGAQADIPTNAKESATETARALLEDEYGMGEEEGAESNVKISVLKTLANALGLQVEVKEKESKMDRNEMVKALEACEACPLEKADLEALSDDGLEAVHERFVANAEGESQGEGEGREGAGEGEGEGTELEGNDASAELLKVVNEFGGVESVRELLSNAKQGTDEEVESLVEDLAANESVAFDEDELREFGLERLRKLHRSLMPADYTGRGFKRHKSGSGDEDDAIPAPPPVVLAKNGTGEAEKEA